MKSVRNLVLAVGVVALSGCTMFDTYSEVDALNEAQPVGSPFTQALAGEYKTFANTELEDMFDYPDALHFARKGLAAASGEAVMPEPVSDWNLSENHIKELGAARGRLVVAFDMGAREIAPSTAALAQAKFDCWIEQQEENWKTEEILRCKTEYLDAMAELEGLVQQKPQPVDVVAEPAPMVPEEAMYLVFFNWDSKTLSAGAKNVLDAVAAEVAKNTPSQITVSGHADTSGDDAYNKRLAFKRANAVRDALVERGVSADILAVESHGESSLLVATSDDVREPANRRVNISFK
ncbi:MAG: cell envelope biogenesis protein OmpA [Alphaproteobacteria bacterium]|nr:MAG: cell envelope biogenesis protein OmpA [Alphaproteobacteria bacterium]